MQNEIKKIVDENKNLLTSRPELRNGLILYKLKNKYPIDDLLNVMEDVSDENFTQFGNYRDYYDYRYEDDRIETLKHLLDEKVILDIGCHSGKIGNDIFMKTKFQFYMGIDIDTHLVKCARDRLAKSIIENHYKLPASLSQKLTRKGREYLLLNNKMQFEHADVLKYTINQKFGVILCLSVVKWIHLEHHDKGLISFLKKAYNLLQENGMFVLELHNEDSYWRKLHPINYKRFLELEIEPSDIPEILISKVGFTRYETLELNEQIGGFQKRGFLLFYK
eukprot:NODE_358_length_8800_cov_0.946673.p3 type:complete len:278 gc:universal NODE_358_length_8800_cov_0.946673:8499-7666(-)